MNYNKFIENSRKWLSQYIKDNHLQSCIIGISGGLDSCVSACIASPICKELRIPLIGRSLPTTTNKPDENNVAKLVGEAFCTDFKEVPINCDDIIHEFELCEGKMNLIQKGNIKARYRMMYLSNLASIHKGIVIDNDNFTEWNVRFFTVHGDVFDVNLGLNYLWKIEIYELAEYLKEYYRVGYIESKNNPDDDMEITEDWFNKYEAIRDSINLTPTDGNSISNSDCEQFELDNYEQVDDVLKTMYYNNRNFSILIKDDGTVEDKSQEYVDKEYIRLIDSYNEQGVDKVMLLHQNTVYKRKPSPIMPTKEELELYDRI